MRGEANSNKLSEHQFKEIICENEWNLDDFASINQSMSSKSSSIFGNISNI